jgi:hypothetical protein
MIVGATTNPTYSQPEILLLDRKDVERSLPINYIDSKSSRGRSKTQMMLELPASPSTMQLTTAVTMMRSPNPNRFHGECLASQLWLQERRQARQAKQTETSQLMQRPVRRGSLYNELRGSGVQESTCEKRQRIYSLLKEAVGCLDDDGY